MKTEILKEASGKLMRVNLDAFEGYRTASENTNDSRITTFFEEAALQRKEFAQHWASHLENPKYGTDIRADLHRVWMNLKTMRQKYNSSAVIAECERGEKHALKEYEKVQEYLLPDEVLQQIERQKRDIQKNLEQLNAMKEDYDDKDFNRNNDTPVP
jgi:uncharacterized protein (TIGR02284 family)